MVSRTLGALLLVAAGCGDAEVSLRIELRTDYVPGAEFDSVEVILDEAIRRSHSVLPEESYLEAVRVAEIDGLVRGAKRVSVRLFSSASRVIAERQVLVQLEGNTGITVVIDRRCQGVECVGGDSCLAGLCRSRECIDGTQASCDLPTCDSSNCAEPIASCATSQCVDGVCLAAEIAGACEPDRYCDPERGCRLRRSPEDAGVAPDAGVRDAATDSGTRDAAGLPGCSDPSVLICDDLEGGVDPAWAPADAPAGSLELTTERSRSGQAVRLSTVTRRAIAGALGLELDPPLTDGSLYLRAWLYLAEYPAERWLIPMQFFEESDAGGSKVSADIWPDGSVELFTPDVATLTEAPAGTIPLGRWFCMELFAELGSEPSAAWLAIDETIVVTATYSPPFAADQARFGAQTDIAPIDVWFDDLVVARERIGCVN